jgi:hypothetical protein
MKDPVLDPRVRGSSKEAVPSGSSRGSPAEAQVIAALESRLILRIDEKLEDVQRRATENLANVIAERVDPVIDSKIRKALQGSVASNNARTKEALLQVIQGVLFESGLLEKLILKNLEQKLQSLPAGGGGGGGTLSEQGKKEVQTLVQKEVATTLSSEQVKQLIDDKFRAISLYLKQEVIPKAVSQILKGPKPAGA